MKSYLINFQTPAVVSPNDSLSKFICHKCVETLNMFFDFREACLSAYIEQHNLLTKGSTMAEQCKEHSYFESTAHRTNPQEKVVEPGSVSADDFVEEDSEENEEEQLNNNSDENCIIVVEPDEEQDMDSPINFFTENDEHNAIIKDTIEADGYFECEDCSAIFMTITDLTGHVETDKCSKSETRKDYSTTQMKNIHVPKKSGRSKRLSNEVKDFKRFLDDRRLVQRSNLREDLKCELCGKEYKTAKGIVAHRRAHAGEKFQCPKCKSAFSDPYDLKYHLRVHSENPKYSCKYCNKAFRNPARVVIHERSHTKERPFVCDTCGKSFITIQSMKLHVRIHTGEKPHGCKYCEKKFRSIPSAMSHQKRHRDGTRMFQCDFCLRMFETNDQLVAHTLQHKSMAVWRCRSCKLCFKKRSTLKCHMRDVHGSSAKSKSDQHGQVQLIETEQVTKCDYCEALVSQQNMAQHLSSEHANEAIFIESIHYSI
ncbi:uncharacterized protein [Bemisia tabaci]|uniref:uncharacterized protein isoform X2 n=1 Tax=Bemisia tabaci TaxID=7038 RepID=UPI003B28B238